MSEFALIGAFTWVLVSALVQVLFDPRITRRFIQDSVWSLLAYGIYVGLGLAAAWAWLPMGPDAVVGTVLAIVGWIGLGGLGLVRLAPRLREPPAFLAQFGIADLVGLAALAAGLWMSVANA